MGENDVRTPEKSGGLTDRKYRKRGHGNRKGATGETMTGKSI